MASRAERKLLKQIEELEVALAGARERAAKLKALKGRSPSARLPDWAIAEIRERYAQGESAREISSVLGVSVPSIHKYTAGQKRHQAPAAPKAVQEEAAARVAAGETAVAIGKALGLKAGTVSKYARERGVHSHGKPFTDAQKSQIEILYASGRPASEIAQIIGRSKVTILKYLQREGLTRKIKHGPRTRLIAMRTLEETGSFTDAAVAAGVAPLTVKRWAQQEGVGHVAQERADVSDEDRDLMVVLREQEFSLGEIGKRVRRPVQTVRDALDAYDRLPRRVEGIRRRARNPRPKKARGPDKGALRRIMRL